MAISLTAVVEASVGTKRFAVDLTAGIEPQNSYYPCAWCSTNNARRVVIKCHRVWKMSSGGIVYPDLLKWMDAVYAAQERLADGTPVCIRCWDHQLLPYVYYRAMFK